MTHRAKPPVNWRVKQASQLVAMLADLPAPVTPLEAAHWHAYMAQAAYALNMALVLSPRPIARPAPPLHEPGELLVGPAPDLRGRLFETWKESPRAEHRYRRLHAAFLRDLRRTTQTLGGFNVGPRLVTFTYPAGREAPEIEKVA